jgi:hypothetical protein
MAQCGVNRIANCEAVCINQLQRFPRIPTANNQEPLRQHLSLYCTTTFMLSPALLQTLEDEWNAVLESDKARLEPEKWSAEFH